MLRCVKNSNGVIIAMGNDENQSGNYPAGSDALGTWCGWTVEENALPAFSPVEGADERAMRFKENVTNDGIELRSDADVLSAPQG